MRKRRWWRRTKNPQILGISYLWWWFAFFIWAATILYFR